VAFLQGLINVDPLFAERSLDLSGVSIWESTNSLRIEVNPDEDLFDCQRREIPAIPSPSLLREESGKRSPTRKATVSVHQRCVDARPGFAWDIKNSLQHHVRP
jgi:hypothetical protein